MSVLVVVVARVARIDQRALGVGTRRWAGGVPSMLFAAGVLSMSVESWSSPSATSLVLGLLGTLAVWWIALRRISPGDEPAPAYGCEHAGGPARGAARREAADRR